MLTHSQPPAYRFMYTQGMGTNGGYNANGVQSYFPMELPPSLLFRSQSHMLPDSTATFTGNVPLDFSAVSNGSVNTSMESINEDTSQSSPEYMTQQQQEYHQNARSYYVMEENVVPPTNWTNHPQTPMMIHCEQDPMEQQRTQGNETNSTNNNNNNNNNTKTDKDIIMATLNSFPSAKFPKNKHQQPQQQTKIKSESKHEIIGMVVHSLFTSKSSSPTFIKAIHYGCICPSGVNSFICVANR